jgi:ribose transport system substrate-binding protein
MHPGKCRQLHRRLGERTGSVDTEPVIRTLRSIDADPFRSADTAQLWPHSTTTKWKEEHMKMKLTIPALLLAAAFAVTGAQAEDKKQLVFVVNGASDFWKLAEAGVRKAQTELPNYDLQFKYPEQAAAAVQQRLMNDLVAAGVSAIMVSAVDPKSSTAALNDIGKQVPLFTTDSDAPDTNRIAYIGSSNTDAGKQAGEIALKALPNGGKCIGFVGLPGADNARERIEGMKSVIAGSKVELIDVRGDDIDMTRAKRNVEDALAANPDIACMVGFYSYNPPRIYEVLKEAGKLGQITVIAFDEDPITLGGVREGTIAGTVVQQPYEWGYQGMKLMAKYLEGDKSVVPDNKLVIVPTAIIDKANVDAFEAELKSRINGG